MQKQSSLNDLESLGLRAKLRRKANGQTGAEIAAIMSVDTPIVYLWEKRLPAKPKKDIEDLWEKALMVPPGWLRDLGMQPTVQTDEDSSDSVLDLTSLGCKTASEEILCIASWLSRNALRKRTYHFENLSGGDARKAEIFARRYGVKGDATLQAIGAEYGLTRERIRQIVDVMLGKIKGVTFVAPCFAALDKAVKESSPISLHDFNEKYRALLGDMLGLEDADRFSREVMGVGIATFSERAFWQAGNAIKRMVMSPAQEDSGLMAVVRDAARRMIRSCGAAQVLYVTGMASESLNIPVSASDVRRILQYVEGMEWIAEDDGWFWFGLNTAGNRAIETAKKVFSVASERVDVEEIQQAICRSRRHRSVNEERRNRPPMVELPRHVLQGVLARVPWLTVVQYDDFVAKTPIKPEDALSGTELALFKFMDLSRGIATRNSLYEHLVVECSLMSAINFQLLLAVSPIVRPYERGVFALRGRNYSMENIGDALQSRPGLRGLNVRPDPDGWLEFDLTITARKFSRAQIEIPVGFMASIPQGQYEFKGIANGTFAIGLPSAANRISGSFLTALRDSNVKDGDLVRLRVHPESKQVVVSIINRDV